MRRLLYLSLAALPGCAVMLLAAFVAQASSPVRLGWMIPQDVSQSGAAAASKGPRIAIDSDGHLHLIWMDDRAGQADLYYARSVDVGNTWWDGEGIPTTPESNQGSLALGSDGTIHACWWEQTSEMYSLLHAERTTGGWSLQPTVVVTGSKIFYPTIAGAGDYLHVVWSGKPSNDGPSLYYTRKPKIDGTWCDPTAITDTAPMSMSGRMAVDASDNLHVVWHERTTPYHQVMYVSGTVGISQTTWSTPITVSAGLAQNATTPGIDVDDDFVVHVVFAVDVAGQDDTQDIYYASFPLSNTEGISPTAIPGSRVRVSEQLPFWASPSIALDGLDEVHVVWHGAMDTDLWERIYYVVSEDHGANWSPPMAISPDDDWADGFPTIATDGTLVHVAWQQEGLGSASDIYYSHSLPIFTLFPFVVKDYS